MRIFNIFLTAMLLCGQAVAGLPPTTSRVSGDSANVTTFNFNFGPCTGSHSGTTVTLAGCPSSFTITANKTANYNIATGDNLVYIDDTAGAITVTLPTVVGFGHPVEICKINSTLTNQDQILTTGGETISGYASGALKVATKDDCYTVAPDGAGTNWRKVLHTWDMSWNDSGPPTMSNAGGGTPIPVIPTTTQVNHLLWQRCAATSVCMQLAVGFTSATGNNAGVDDYLWGNPAGIQWNSTYITFWTTIVGNSAVQSPLNILGTGAGKISSTATNLSVSAFDANKVRIYYSSSGGGGMLCSAAGVSFATAPQNIAVTYGGSVLNWTP